MQSAAITLTNQATGDRLLVNGSAAASGTLASGIAWTRTDTSVTLSGSFTKAEYADAIELVQFENTTENPSTTPRIINVTVNDGTVDSNVAVATINVTAVDDAPVNTVPGAQSVNEDTSLAISGISVTDFDVGNPTQVGSTVLSVNNGGTLNVTAAGGAVVTNNGTSSVTITGTAAQINATLLNNVNYLGALNFNGTETLNVLTTDAGGVNSDSDDIVITVTPVVNAIPGPERRFLEPESFLNTDSINTTIYEWAVANDPTSPILSAIHNIRNETALNSRQGVFQTDSATRAELIAGSGSESATPTYVQNSVRHVDLEPSSASIQQAVKASQLESMASGIRVDSADNTAIPVVTNIIDPFTPLNPFASDKGLADSEQRISGENTQNRATIKPVIVEKQVSGIDAQSEKPQPTTDESQAKKSYSLDPKPISNLNQEDDSEDNLVKKKAAKSFSSQLRSQLQSMVKNTSTSSDGAPSDG